MYGRVMGQLDKVVPPRLLPLWNHPAGMKPVFFWAPAFKWCLVIAGIGDLQRPAEKLSPTQSTALAATGNTQPRSSNGVYRCTSVIVRWYIYQCSGVVVYIPV